MSDPKKKPMVIVDLEIREVSLVRNPANPDSRVRMIKTAPAQTLAELRKSAHEAIKRHAAVLLADASASRTPFGAAEVAIAANADLAAAAGVTTYAVAAELAREQDERDAADRKARAHAKRREPGI